MILAVISSEANIKNRARYQEIARQLAHRARRDEPRARALAKEGKAIVWIDGGLHATEVAHAQHTPELGVVAGRPRKTTRRGGCARTPSSLLMPKMNPDGLDIVRGLVQARTSARPSRRRAPPELYHHYVGHDNNRDWYMFTQVETQAVARQLYHVWFPQIVYNHHQSGPFPGRIWGPPMKDPVNPNLDPLIVSTINQIGEAMRKRFDDEEKPGYNSDIAVRHVVERQHARRPDFHNMAGLPDRDRALPLRDAAVLRGRGDSRDLRRAAQEPAGEDPEHELHESVAGRMLAAPRQPVEYMLTASRATLDLARS